jgi:hypothetical protein
MLRDLFRLIWNRRYPCCRHIAEHLRTSAETTARNADEARETQTTDSSRPALAISNAKSSPNRPVKLAHAGDLGAYRGGGNLIIDLSPGLLRACQDSGSRDIYSQSRTKRERRSRSLALPSFTFGCRITAKCPSTWVARSSVTSCACFFCMLLTTDERFHLVAMLMRVLSDVIHSQI